MPISRCTTLAGKTTTKQRHFRQMHVSEINTLNLIMSTLWLNTLMSFNLCREIVWSAAYKFLFFFLPQHTSSFIAGGGEKTVYTFIFIHFSCYMRVCGKIWEELVISMCSADQILLERNGPRKKDHNEPVCLFRIHSWVLFCTSALLAGWFWAHPRV